MILIPIEVSGDVWNNPKQVQQQLDQTPQSQHVVLDFRAEGPSMYALGICKMIDQWLESQQRAPDTVTVTCWSNATEIIPYNKSACSVPSHFWKLSKSYWHDTTTVVSGKLFAFFLGRDTVARNTIMYQIATQWSDHFVLSKMRSHHMNPWANPDPENNSWMIEDVDSMIQWYKECPVASIDNKSVRDQFGDPDNHARVNSSLLEYYNQFNIELVCETYTLGTTFFPTEKTARPIMAAKPILVYGPVGFLNELKRMGFKTYSELWDESYDLLQGVDRWLGMKKVIQQLILLDKLQQQELLAKANSIAMFNRQHLANFVKL